MDSKLQEALKSAANALAAAAEETDSIIQELSELRAKVERQEVFNQKLKSIFDEFYGGTI